MMKRLALPSVQPLICAAAVAFTTCSAVSAQEGTNQARSLERLISELTNHNAEIRQNAAYQLRAMGPSASNSVPALSRALKDEESFVVDEAVEALQNIGPPAAGALPNLIMAYFDPNNADIGRVSRALRAIGFSGRTTPSNLYQTLSETGPAERLFLMSVIMETNKPSAPDAELVRTLLHHEDKIIRRGAVLAAGKIGLPCVPDLIAALDDSSWEARSTATEHLARIKPVKSEIVPALLKAFKDQDRWVRIKAVEAVRDVASSTQWAEARGRPVDPRLVDALIITLGDSDSSVATFSCIVLGDLGPTAKKAVPALRRFAENPNAVSAINA